MTPEVLSDLCYCMILWSYSRFYHNYNVSIMWNLISSLKYLSVTDVLKNTNTVQFHMKNTKLLLSCIINMTNNTSLWLNLLPVSYIKLNQLQKRVLLAFNRITDSIIRLFIILIFFIYKQLLYMNFITFLLCPWYPFLRLITVPNFSTGWDSTVEKWWGGGRFITYVNEACRSYTLQSFVYFVQFGLVYLSP